MSSLQFEHALEVDKYVNMFGLYQSKFSVSTTKFLISLSSYLQFWTILIKTDLARYAYSCMTPSLRVRIMFLVIS